MPFLRVIAGQETDIALQDPCSSPLVQLRRVHCSSCLPPNPGTRLEVDISFHPAFRGFLTYAHGMCVSQHPLAGLPLTKAPSPRSRELRQAGLRGPYLGPQSLSGSERLFLDQWVPGCLAEELLLPRLTPLLPTSLLCKQVSRMTSLLDCSVEGRWNEAPMELGVDTCTFYCQPAVVFLSLRGSKKQKNKDGAPSCFFLACEASSTTALGPLPTRGY